MVPNVSYKRKVGGRHRESIGFNHTYNYLIKLGGYINRTALVDFPPPNSRGRGGGNGYSLRNKGVMN